MTRILLQLEIVDVKGRVLALEDPRDLLPGDTLSYGPVTIMLKVTGDNMKSMSEELEAYVRVTYVQFGYEWQNG